MPFAIVIPPPAIVVTDANQAHWRDEGWALLLALAKPLRLVDALRQKRLTPEQGRRLLMGVVNGVTPTLQAITQSLVAGAMKLGGWWRSMRDALIPAHFAGSIALINDPTPPPADREIITQQAN